MNGFDAKRLARIGENLVKRFGPPPVVSAVLRERCKTAKDQGDLASNLLRIAMLYGHPERLVRFLAREDDADPIPWYGLRPEHIKRLVTFYRGHLSPKTHRRLCRTLADGMTIVHEAGHISADDMAAIRQVTGAP